MVKKIGGSLYLNLINAACVRGNLGMIGMERLIRPMTTKKRSASRIYTYKAIAGSMAETKIKNKSDMGQVTFTCSLSLEFPKDKLQ